MEAGKKLENWKFSSFFVLSVKKHWEHVYSVNPLSWITFLLPIFCIGLCIQEKNHTVQDDDDHHHDSFVWEADKVDGSERLHVRYDLCIRIMVVREVDRRWVQRTASRTPPRTASTSDGHRRDWRHVVWAGAMVESSHMCLTYWTGQLSFQHAHSVMCL